MEWKQKSWVLSDFEPYCKYLEARMVKTLALPTENQEVGLFVCFEPLARQVLGPTKLALLKGVFIL